MMAWDPAVSFHILYLQVALIAPPAVPVYITPKVKIVGGHGLHLKLFLFPFRFTLSFLMFLLPKNTTRLG